MKEEWLKFKCDKCNKEIVVEKEKGFPYEEGWKYLYNLNFQICNTLPICFFGVERRIIRDAHFCSKKCFIDYIKNLMKEKKEVKDGRKNKR